MAKKQGKGPMQKRKDEMPSASERAELTAKLVAMGYRGQDLAVIIKAGRTRKQIADDLIARQRHAAKAS